MSKVWRGAVALVTGAHVGAFEVGARTVCADLWLQALIHINALSVPASEAFCAGDTLVRAGGVHTLLIRTSARCQTLINILTMASPAHPVAAVTIFTPEGPHSVDTASLPTYIGPQTFIHIYAASALFTGHESCWADTQETSLSVLTAPLGAQVLGLSTFVNINTFPLPLTELVAFIANTGIPHRKVNTVSRSTDVWVHSTFIDFCYLGRCNHLAGT